MKQVEQDKIRLTETSLSLGKVWLVKTGINADLKNEIFQAIENTPGYSDAVTRSILAAGCCGEVAPPLGVTASRPGPQWQNRQGLGMAYGGRCH